jgi:hypothetical protein
MFLFISYTIVDRPVNEDYNNPIEIFNFEDCSTLKIMDLANPFFSHSMDLYFCP